MQRRRTWIVGAILLLVAFGFRIAVARYLANDTPGDGKLYTLLARNLLEQHVYSHDAEPPYRASLIRLPGYPFFLTAIYYFVGHENNTAVRIAHALIDTVTCALVGLLAYLWTPFQRSKQVAAHAAIALAAICPFTAIYVGTILTETWASFFLVLLCLLATLAFQAPNLKKSIWLWAAVGLVGGVQVFFRPDSGLFVLAVGLTLVATLFSKRRDSDEVTKKSSRLTQIILQGAIMSVAFMIVLVPWTVRNWRTFHLFQPLAPAHAEMPGEFVPRGYLAWLRTWINDDRYVESVLWPLDYKQLHLEDFPASAFDSAEEKNRVAQLLDQYNNPAGGITDEQDKAAAAEPSPGDEADQSSDDSDDEQDDTTGGEPDTASPEMTPAIDAQFAQLAQKRIALAPLRYYVWVPMQRAWSLWVGPHSDYYPFDGELFPLSDLDYSVHQHIWLPLFMFLVFIFTLLGMAGAWMLWRFATTVSRRWVLLVALLIFIRLAFFASLENPEPRYTVEFFPLLASLGGIALASFRPFGRGGVGLLLRFVRSGPLGRTSS
jgi:hypothetical protein